MRAFLRRGVVVAALTMSGLLLVGTTPASAAAEMYRKSTITSPGRAFAAGALNDRGEVLVSFTDEFGPSTATVYNLRTKRLRSLRLFSTSSASGINNRGEVAGTGTGGPFVWNSRSGTVRMLQVPKAPRGASILEITLSEISDLGVVAGEVSYIRPEDVEAEQGPYLSHAVLWKADGTAKALPPLDILTGINNRGDTIGTASMSAYVRRASGRLVNLPGEVVSVDGINNKGEVAGVINTPDGLHAALWKPNGRLCDLEKVSTGGTSSVAGINDKSQVAGARSRDWMEGRAPYRSVIWNGCRGPMTELPDEPTGETFPISINQRGEVTGASYHDFLAPTILWSRGRCAS